MSSKINSIYDQKLKEETVIKGIKQPIGTKVTMGAICPRCKTHYPRAMKVTYCNKCGHRSKTLKPHELKKKSKMLKRMEYEKENN